MWYEYVVRNLVLTGNQKYVQGIPYNIRRLVAISVVTRSTYILVNGAILQITKKNV